MFGPGSKLWSYVLIAGSGMLVFAFAMPWWGVTMTKIAEPERPKLDNNNREAFTAAVEKYPDDLKKYDRKKRAQSKITESRWYLDRNIDDDLRDKVREADDDVKSVTVRLWGPHIGAGITAFIFGLIILPLTIVPMFVRQLRDWAWIGSIVAAIFGLVSLILGMVFYFGSPGKNTEYIAQGVGLSLGPYLVLLGSLGILVAGVFDGVFGVLGLVKGLKSENAASLPPVELELDDNPDEG